MKSTPAIPSPPHSQNAPAKRKVSLAGLATAGRTVKRRASRACHCCRSRKVRCDVVESGTPCTNCRLDEVECVVSDSKRRRKPRGEGECQNQSPLSSNDDADELPALPEFDGVNVDDISSSFPGLLDSTPTGSFDFDLNHHVPHMLYQTQGHRMSTEERARRMSTMSQLSVSNLPSVMQMAGGAPYSPQRASRPPVILPRYIRPLPPKIMSEEMEYLEAKGALVIPETAFRNELLRSYVQYVHPYMPHLELKDFLQPIERNDGSSQVSLLLFQAVMFAATAYIDMRFLNAQGYESRKSARKAFFQRARLLYDFDYEVDRISLVQALLLMTYWYETPDDQKDTWHWMGVSLSLAHTIGLHRNPENSNMDLKKQSLWKRIWWSCYMRDRLIALGMRRPTRIKDEDCDVPMLEVKDFDTEPLPTDIVRMLGGCPAIRDTSKRTKLAKMCIEKARLCVCISHVLSAQYSVLSHKFGGTTETTMMLVPKKAAAGAVEVLECDQELERWFHNLSTDLRYRQPGSKELAKVHDGEVLQVHRALLSLIYFTTSSALHRPQVLPAQPTLGVPTSLQDLSRRRVREAASEITEIGQDLYDQDLIRFLPTTGVTVLLPAVIIHLLDIKSNDPSLRVVSLRRFYQCMQILQRLREIYASADFAFSFLEAAIRKANIEMPAHIAANKVRSQKPERALSTSSMLGTHSLTPPPDPYASNNMPSSGMSFDNMNFFSVPTPPKSDGNGSVSFTVGETALEHQLDLMDVDDSVDLSKNDFDALINFDAGADLFAAEDGVGVDLDLDWMAAMTADAIPEKGEERPSITGDLDTDLGIVA